MRRIERTAVTIELVSLALLDTGDDAVVHVSDPVAEVEDAVVVRHDDDGPVGPDRRILRTSSITVSPVSWSSAAVGSSQTSSRGS